MKMENSFKDRVWESLLILKKFRQWLGYQVTFMDRIYEYKIILCSKYFECHSIFSFRFWIFFPFLPFNPVILHLFLTNTLSRLSVIPSHQNSCEFWKQKSPIILKLQRFRYFLSNFIVILLYGEHKNPLNL